MAKQTFSMHLYAKEVYDPETRTSPVRFNLQAHADLEFSGTYVGPVMAEAEVPQTFDMRAAKVAALEAERTKLRAEFNKRIVEIQRQINELTALEAA